jgi:uncharacterized protein CbrC (UPF0167 family)
MANKSDAEKYRVMQAVRLIEAMTTVCDGCGQERKLFVQVTADPEDGYRRSVCPTCDLPGKHAATQEDEDHATTE